MSQPKTLCILVLVRKLAIAPRNEAQTQCPGPILVCDLLAGFTGTPGLPGASRPFEACQDRMERPLWIWRNSVLD